MTALTGLRVIEIGTLIAAPFAARLLAEFGAEVIKIEALDKGDPLRKWRKLHEGTSLWWYLQSRNKKSLALNLRSAEGVALVKQLVEGADVLIENLRPGALEKLGLGWDVLHALNPKLTLVRISGYGQTGPYRDRPGFGAIGEAMGGIRYTTGTPGVPPARVGVSLGDSLASMHAVIGALMSVLRVKTGQGERPDLAQNDGRARHCELIDEAIAAWTGSRGIDEVLEILEGAEVPAGRIYSAADIVADPHYQAREMLLDTTLPDGATLKMPGIVPKLSATPGQVNWQGPTLGEHTDGLLTELGLSEADIQRLRKGGVVQ